jgi:arsenite methyltransferase
LSSQTDLDQVRDAVRERYSNAARVALQGGIASCCDGGATVSPIVIGNYRPDETHGLPEMAVLASLGCGNPTALIELKPGETVLDLGSGGGIDVLLSARRVGPHGFAYGLDMTDEMLELAEKNRVEAGADNVRFLKGHMEAIPLPDNSVDVVISNCVINLSADKDAVLREAFRVLRPGGRFAVSDIVLDGEPDTVFRGDMDSWSACVAGALEKNDYLRRLETVGFEQASIEVTRAYTSEEIGAAGSCCDGSSCCSSGEAGGVGVESGFIRATKPL